jgi:hypothetical protein
MTKTAVSAESAAAIEELQELVNSGSPISPATLAPWPAQRRFLVPHIAVDYWTGFCASNATELVIATVPTSTVKCSPKQNFAVESKLALAAMRAPGRFVCRRTIWYLNPATMSR